jgi:hypothetical protein
MLYKYMPVGKYDDNMCTILYIYYCMCLCAMPSIKSPALKWRAVANFPWRERVSSWGGEKLSDCNPFKPMPQNRLAQMTINLEIETLAIC